MTDQPMQTTAEEIIDLLEDEIGTASTDILDYMELISKSYTGKYPLNNLQYREVIGIYTNMHRRHQDIVLLRKLINEIQAYEEGKVTRK